MEYMGESNTDNPLSDVTEGLDEIPLSDEVHGESHEEGADGVGGCTFDDKTAVNGLDALWNINFSEISAEELMKFHFSDVDVAFVFYNWYASIHGFAGRKSKYMRNKIGEITQQTFVCYREGHRKEIATNNTNRKRRSRPPTRCGCEAKCRVHVEVNSGRWYIKYFDDVHNHTLLDYQYVGMLPAHRKMSEYDKYQMMNMRKVGIRTPHIYGLFASQAGGFEKVGFRKRDMYNEQERQRRTKFSDAKDALEFLEGIQSDDDMMFWRHTVKGDGRLEHLFWCDGTSRRDFAVFGDVLAFDATYRKIKYMCPLVVFSGVNHHNQSIVFASAIVSNETEDTYVWLLEQFVAAMDGKIPGSVITDGDMAMRNAIRRVFPRAHHRLCAWHLLRNATSNVRDVKFVSKFKRCMLGDYDVAEFQRKWDEMITNFGLEDNSWVRDTYEKRNMWATAHIRGNFFAGFRTTSRCEGLHSEFGKYVSYQNNLVEFLQHYFRCLSYMRYKEVEADFSSIHGDPVLQTQFKAIERHAAVVYTREIFLVVRPIIEKATTCRIVGSKQTESCYDYTISRYCKEGVQWHVSYYPSTLEFKCSCLRFESLGITCEHLLYVIAFLDIKQLPECVVLNRWTKNAKESVGLRTHNFIKDPVAISQYTCVVERCKRMAKAAVDCGKPQYIRKTVELIDAQTEMLEAIGRGDDVQMPDTGASMEGMLRNPARARSKGCGGASSSAPRKRLVRKAPSCGLCGAEGHNRKSCHLQRQACAIGQTQVDSNDMDEVNDFGNECSFDH